ncbi:hypothetical protein H5410_015720 [Solanum commersonii]|uniref:Uncharacterized protein n=1 Tax=Solanum commersonii TaxID=4109 RepID=A0A9J5ZUM0_SOLCO|nr:hypothetical protein H5410_015720 [Solanum commersonii]
MMLRVQPLLASSFFRTRLSKSMLLSGVERITLRSNHDYRDGIVRPEKYFLENLGMIMRKNLGTLTSRPEYNEMLVKKPDWWPY